jgi:hypothetical protein
MSEMKATTASLLPRDIGEHACTYLGCIQHRSSLIQSRKDTALAYRASLATTKGSGAVDSGKQYHGCRHEQRPTYCTFQKLDGLSAEGIT